MAILTTVLLTAVTLCSDQLPLDRYQGYAPVKRRATGEFRTEQISSRWFLITPDGHPYLTIGVNHVGNALISDKAFKPPSRFFTESGGDREKAAQLLVHAVKELNFNSAGGYGPQLPELTRELPYFDTIGYPPVKNKKFLGGEKFEFDPFDPIVHAVFDEFIRDRIKQSANDPLCMGYSFIDIPVWDERRIQYFQRLPENAPGRLVYEEHSADPDRFLGVVADAFYRMMRDGIDQVAPNKMMLGEKFVTGKVPLTVVRAIKPHIDIFAIQPLGGEKKEHCIHFPRELMDSYYDILQMPILLPDYGCTFPTRQTPETHWHQLKSEQAAAASYSNYLDTVFDAPYMVGVHRCELLSWYKTVGRRHHWRQGILDPAGNPYPLKTAAVRKTNRDVLKKIYQSIPLESTCP